MEVKPKLNRREHGFGYEEKAAAYLTERGYRLIARNVNFKSGEIDLVLENGSGRKLELVFVEVRKRGAGSYIRAEETLTYTKERRLRSAIDQFLLRYRGHAQSIRVDLIAFQNEELRHFPNFLP